MIAAMNRSHVLPIIILLAFLFIPFYHCLAQQEKMPNTVGQLSEKDKQRITPQKSHTLTNQSLRPDRSKGLMVILMLAFLVCLMLYYRLKEKRKLGELKMQMADQKRAVKSLLERVQDERLGMAKTIHDNIGQRLAVAKMNLSNLAFGAQNDALLISTQNLLDETASELRNISQQLIPEGLNFGLFSAIEELCDHINQQGGPRITLQLPDRKEQVQLAKNRALSMYHVVQEILTDRIRYAEATEIKIKLDQNQLNLIFEMVDNGEIFDVKKMQGDRKINWISIVMRIDLLNGILQNQPKKLTENQLQISFPNHDSND